MATVIAQVFDYSLDGFVAEEGTSFYDFCRELPDDPVRVGQLRSFYERADLHIMGRGHYEDAAGYFPSALDHPYADVMNAARKVVFSRTLGAVSWANTTVARGDLAAEISRLAGESDGYIVAQGGTGFWRSLVGRDLIDEYRVSLVPYVAGKGTRLFDDLGRSPGLELVSAATGGNGIAELVYRRVR